MEVKVIVHSAGTAQDSGGTCFSDQSGGKYVDDMLTTIVSTLVKATSRWE